MSAHCSLPSRGYSYVQTSTAQCHGVCVCAPALGTACNMCARREQESLKQMLSEEDSLEVLSWRDGERFAGLKLVGGVDISFNKSNPDEACAIVVVLSFPQLQVILSVAYRAQFVTCSNFSPPNLHPRWSTRPLWCVRCKSLIYQVSWPSERSLTSYPAFVNCKRGSGHRSSWWMAMECYTLVGSGWPATSACSWTCPPSGWPRTSCVWTDWSGRTLTTRTR